MACMSSCARGGTLGSPGASLRQISGVVLCAGFSIPAAASAWVTKAIRSAR